MAGGNFDDSVLHLVEEQREVLTEYTKELQNKILQLQVKKMTLWRTVKTMQKSVYAGLLLSFVAAILIGMKCLFSLYSIREI